MAADRDPVLDVADRLLMIPDLFHFWLAGTAVSEYTNATTTQCFDAQSRSWARDLLGRLGVPPDVLPEVVEPATKLGPMRPESANRVNRRRRC